MTFTTLLLICAATLSHADCTRDTAEVVMRGPEVRSEVGCGLAGQAFVAESAMAAWLEEGHFLKVQCTRTSIGKENVG